MDQQRTSVGAKATGGAAGRAAARGWQRRLGVAALVAVSLGLAACSSPEDKVASFYKKGQGYMQSADYVKASLEFKNALQINPNNVPAMYGLALIAEHNSNWDQTNALLRRVIELDPQHLQAHIKLGKLLLAAGRAEAAKEYSDAAMALAPTDADVIALRAAIVFQQGDRAQAVELAKQALEQRADQTDALVVLATARIADGDIDGGLARLDEALKTNERDLALQLIKARTLEKAGRLDDAEATYQKLLGFNPGSKEMRHLLAQFYMAHGKPAQAEEQYRAAAKEHPDDLQAKLDVVRFIGGTKGPQAAADELQQLIVAQPKQLELKLALASLRKQEGQLDAARALWNEVADQAGDEAAGLSARAALATDALAQGDKAGAARQLSDILAKDARNEQALVLRASIAMDERRLDDAVGDLRTVLRDTPASAQAAALLARTYELQGAPELAQEQYARAAQNSKYAPIIAMPYAQFLASSGKERLVEGVLREVLQASPQYLPAYQMLAQTYLNLGNLEGAAQVVQAVARLPGQELATLQLTGALAAAHGNWDAAITAYKKAHELAPADLQSVASLLGTYQRAGMAPQARAFMQSAVAAAPDALPLRLMQAQLAQQTGDAAAARKGFEDVIARDPKNTGAYLGLASLMDGNKQPEQADQVIEQALQQLPGQFELRTMRAGLLQQMDKNEDAIALYEQLLKERPNADLIANNLASLLSDAPGADQARYDRAYELARRLRGSSVPQFLDTLGWASYRVGRFEEAHAPLRDAVAAMPQSANAHYHLGMNQLAQNNKPGARKTLQQALDLAAKSDSPAPWLDDARKALEGL